MVTVNGSLRAMSNESEVIQPLTATVGFVRKIAVNSQYNNTELSLYLPVEIPRVSDFDGDLEAYFKRVDENLRTGFTTAKGLVFEQLGLEYDDVNGILTEKVISHFPGATVEGASQQRPTAPASTPSAGMPAECPKCHGTDFYDNRPKKADGSYKANAPDFKCRAQGCGNGVWLKKKGS